MTATSIREIPVKTLEENRAILNKHRASTGASKISFTHLVAWAILRALYSFPRLNAAYAEQEGQAHRIQRDSVRLGIAVDVQKRDGSARCWCRTSRTPTGSTSRASSERSTHLVSRARKGTISPDDFMGTTISLTNPGTVVKKLAPSGALIWERVYGLSGFRIEVGSDNQAVVSGYPSSGPV